MDEKKIQERENNTLVHISGRVSFNGPAETVNLCRKTVPKKNYDSKSLQTFKRWSFSDDFTVETDDEAQISL